MSRLIIFVMFALLFCTTAHAADDKVQLEFEEIACLQSSAAITEAAPIALSNADKSSDAILIGGGIDSNGKQFAGRLYLALMYDADIGTATSISVKIQVSADGSTFYDVLPSNAFTITADTVAVRAISVPACKYIKVYFTKDAADGTCDIDLLRIWRL